MNDTPKEPRTVDVIPAPAKPSKGLDLKDRGRGQRLLNRLNQAEYYKLYRWLESVWSEVQPVTTRAQLAQRATTVLGFEIGEFHIKGALETMGLSIPQAKKVASVDQSLYVLAQVVTLLVNEVPLLGQKVPEELYRQLKDLL